MAGDISTILVFTRVQFRPHERIYEGFPSIDAWRNCLSKSREENQKEGKTLLDYSPKEWAEFVKEVGSQWIELTKTKTKETRGLAYPVYIIIAVIFGGIAYLASQHLIDGQSVTFLAGTIIGYLLSYLGGYIKPEKY